jgi:hypothetical protein
MIGRGAHIAVIQPHQQLPGVDELIVRHRNFGDEPRYVWRDRRDVAADIGVIRALKETIDGPPVVAVARCRQDQDAGKAEQGDALQG